MVIGYYVSSASINIETISPPSFLPNVITYCFCFRSSEYYNLVHISEKSRMSHGDSLGNNTLKIIPGGWGDVPVPPLLPICEDQSLARQKSMLMPHRHGDQPVRQP